MGTKKKPYVRPRWDDMDNFTKKLEERRELKLAEHDAMVQRIAELRMALGVAATEHERDQSRYERLLEEARCERDTATEKYAELSAWVDRQRKKKKGLRGPRP